MRILTLILVTVLLIAPALAHDEGHGPKMGKERPKYGGKLANFVEMKTENGKVTLAETPLLKGELAKVGKNELRLFIYDTEMKPIKLDAVTAVKGFVETKDRKTKQWTREGEFEMDDKRRYLSARIPGKPRRPFNIEIELLHNDKKLLAHFSHIH